jgi:toxin-antitoxin system PIN domain toxin
VIYLLDTNILIAAAWPKHQNHLAAQKFFTSILSAHGFATCPITQLGFLRISWQFYAPGLADAETALEMFLEHPRHVFWADELAANKLKASNHGQLTDAYLLKLAERNGGKLATFDKEWKKEQGAFVLDAKPVE